MKKWILGALVMLVSMLFVALPVIAGSKLQAPTGVSSGLAARTADAAHGGALVKSTLGCFECHGGDLGGKVITDDPVFGRIVGPNLTRGKGGLGARSLTDWDLGIRHGVRRDGSALVMMPSDGYASLSANDLRDVAAWLNELAPVDRELPATRLGPVGAALVLSGKLRVPAWTITHADVPGDDAKLESRGAYLINVSGCRGCHGLTLEGHEVRPGAPKAPALNATALASWSREDFTNALQHGRARDGHTLDELMPWKSFALLPAEDVDALWATLRQP